MTRIHDLELKLQSGLHRLALTHRDEEARRLKLHTLYARDENALLKNRFDQKSVQYHQLSKQSDKVRVQLDGAKETIHGQDIQLKKQTLEIKNLKVRGGTFVFQLQGC